MPKKIIFRSFVVIDYPYGRIVTESEKDPFFPRKTPLRKRLFSFLRRLFRKKKKRYSPDKKKKVFYQGL